MQTKSRALLMGGVLASAALLSGCDWFNPDPEETTPAQAQALVDALQFVKHKSGQCFGVVTVSRLSTSGSAAMQTSMAAVDCAKVGL